MEEPLKKRQKIPFYRIEITGKEIQKKHMFDQISLVKDHLRKRSLTKVTNADMLNAVLSHFLDTIKEKQASEHSKLYYYCF